MSLQQAAPPQPTGPSARPDVLSQAPLQLDAKVGLAAGEWDGALEQKVMTATTPAEIEDVGKAILTKFPTLAPEQIAELVHKMERLMGMYHGEFLSEVSRLLAARLRECTSTQFAQLMSAFLMWKADTRERFSEYAKEFSSTCFAELPSRLMEMAPHELNCCLAGLMSLGHADQRFFVAVGRSALARHKTFGPAQLAALLTILSEMRLVHLDLFTSAAQVTCARVRELRPADVMRVLRAFAKCNVQHETLCHAISTDIITRFKDKGSQSGFSIEYLCEVAWMMCVLQSYHEELLRLVLRQLGESPKVATDALCMMYEVHLALDSEYKDAYSKFRIPLDKAMALQVVYKQNRKDARRCSDRVRSDVSTVLKSLVEGTVHANHRTSIGLLTDVAVLKKRSSTDGYIHIDIDSQLTCVRPIEHEDTTNAPVMLDGSVTLRRRLLTKNNLKLITVNEQQWRRLDDSKEKRRHLRTLLASLGDVIEP
uniref:RAP domain-containing protein n=1 Tax=Zooxanthella nutricula TaxID=1333877 RepID=A0A7S2PSK6_9DINO